jgi:tRNA modification GTPase
VNESAPPQQDASANATIATVVTPSGRGAVAVVIVEGPAAARIISANLRPAFGPDFAARKIGRIVFGRWGRNATGEEVVACRKSETVAEVHCHGGSAAVSRILDDLAAAGALILDWPTWRLGTTSDLIEAEADIALARVTTERTARILLDQRQGTLRSAIVEVIASLDRGDVERAAAKVATLVDRFRLGQHLTQPWQIVLAGPPNVGKSSLINCLLGYERAIVFDQPGTTRDVVTALTALDGWPCELSDTAGLRETRDELEQAGVERAQAQIAKADLVIVVQEANQVPLNSPNSNLLSPDSCLPRILQVLNKIDLASNVPDRQQAAPDIICTSAKTGQGIDELITAVVAQLIDRPPDPGEAIPFTPRQAKQLHAASLALSKTDFQAAQVALRGIFEKG